MRFTSIELLLAMVTHSVDLLVDEEPSAGVEEQAGIAARFVAIRSGDQTLNLDLARGEEVDAGNTLVSNGHLALNCVNVESLEAVAVVEDGTVRRADGQLQLGQLGQHTEVAHLVVHHRRIAGLKGLCQHIN